MTNIAAANWIKPEKEYGERCPLFKRQFSIIKEVKCATLSITALGVYEAELNGQRVGEFILAPGWTSYQHRLQYQTYDVTSMIQEKNDLHIMVGKGWCVGRIGYENKSNNWHEYTGILGILEITYLDDSKEVILTDESWKVTKSPILWSEIYDGESYDARVIAEEEEAVAIFEHSKEILISQQGEEVKEIESVQPVKMIVTPKGERVIDFGQNLTGYVAFEIDAKAGEQVAYSHAEVLDHEGNFYTANLRAAKQQIFYTCKEGKQSYKPHFSFQGFRYIRLDSWSGEIDLADFKAIVVHSNMRRTGYFECSNPMINQLFKNIIWGQKGNFLDVPTDCPQRDERLGWTGDAQVFIRTASYNYNVQKFFEKWLTDLKVEQFEDGGVPAVIPNMLGESGANSSAWGDAAVICPWQIYLTYGNQEVLVDQFESMKRWIDYIRAQGEDEYLWQTGHHYGDWVGLDAPEGSYRGATDEGLIATAFYAYSTGLFIKAGKVLGKDMASYEALYQNVRRAFNETYLNSDEMAYNTQTAYALMLYFDLVDNKAEIAAKLAQHVKANGNKLTTGFVGTPYLLHALSQNGYAEIAYSLLLQEEYPSWIYSIKQGATTIWEHWDGLKPDGSMWSTDMNSFNHYAYGACADWMYGVMAGINTTEEQPGFKHILFKPVIDRRLDYVKASIETKEGIVASSWNKKGDQIEYRFIVPSGTTATICIEEMTYRVEAGEYTYIL